MASGEWIQTGDNLGDYATITYSATSQLVLSAMGTDKVTPALFVGDCDRMILMPFATHKVTDVPVSCSAAITFMPQLSMDGTNWCEAPSDGTSAMDGPMHAPGFDATIQDSELGWLDFNAKYIRFRHEPVGTAVPVSTVFNLVVYKQYFGKAESKRRR